MQFNKLSLAPVVSLCTYWLIPVYPVLHLYRFKTALSLPCVLNPGSGSLLFFSAFFETFFDVLHCLFIGGSVRGDKNGAIKCSFPLILFFRQYSKANRIPCCAIHNERSPSISRCHLRWRCRKIIFQRVAKLYRKMIWRFRYACSKTSDAFWRFICPFNLLLNKWASRI